MVGRENSKRKCGEKVRKTDGLDREMGNVRRKYQDIGSIDLNKLQIHSHR